MKTWEEETKLDKAEAMLIIMYIIVSIFNIYVLFKTKNMVYLSNIMLLWALAFLLYTSIKMRKSKNAIIEFQDNFIDTLYMELLEKEQIIKLSDIIIPKKFTKPKREKMKERSEYYREYRDFKVPIVLDKNNVLIDGYTTYLVARKEGFSHVYIKKESK